MKKFTGLFIVAALAAGVFLGNPLRAEEYSKKDQETIEALKKTYPLDTCVVTGDKLGSLGKPVDYLYKYKSADGKEQVRLVRFCCGGCPATFKKDPDQYLKKIDDAAKAKAASPK